MKGSSNPLPELSEPGETPRQSEKGPYVDERPLIRPVVTEVRAVNDVSLEIAAGEIALIKGPSGSGKTTLLSVLGGLLRPTKGHVEINGVDITGGSEALPRTLSGGEKQHVAVARALINQAPLILADEPTGNLDSHSGQEVMMTLHEIAREEGRVVLVVTHDPRLEDIADGSLRDRKAEPHAWVIDPVCGMRIDGWTATLFEEHQGTRYAFCSARCQERFRGRPDAYLQKALVGLET